MTAPTEPAGIYADAGPHTGRLIPALARFWTHVFCALFVPLLVGTLAVATSEVLGCIGGLTVGRSPESGFWYTCVQPAPVAEPVAEMWWSNPGGSTYDFGEPMVAQPKIEPGGGLYINEYEPAVSVMGDGQLQLGKTDKYMSDVPCTTSNEGAVLYFKRFRQVLLCNGNVWGEP